MVDKIFVTVNIEDIINHGKKTHRSRVIISNINEPEISKPIRDRIGDAYVPIISDNTHEKNKLKLTTNTANSGNPDSISDSIQKKSCCAAILTTRQSI